MGIWEEYDLWEEQMFKESVMRSLPYGEEVECHIDTEIEDELLYL